MQIIFSPDGDGRCVYDEAIDLRCLGKVTIERGSRVEPNENGRWITDLSVPPVNGPVLGPFDTRSEAIAAEVAWLHEFWLQPRGD